MEYITVFSKIIPWTVQGNVSRIYFLNVGRNGVLLSTFDYRDEIETRKLEKIPISSQIGPRGLSVGEGP